MASVLISLANEMGDCSKLPQNQLQNVVFSTKSGFVKLSTFFRNNDQFFPTGAGIAPWLLDLSKPDGIHTR